MVASMIPSIVIFDTSGTYPSWFGRTSRGLRIGGLPASSLLSRRDGVSSSALLVCP